ncbi:MAG: hypothetical protein ACI4MF_01980 [Candidatus Faecivicinus sp.]
MLKFDPDTSWHGWDVSQQELRRTGRACLLLTAANAGLSVLCGVCRTGVTRDNWVGFAATAALVALMAEAIGVVRLLLSRPALSRTEFEGVHRMILWGAFYHILLTIVALLAGIIACVRAFTGPMDLLVLLGLALTALCSAAVRKCYARLPRLEIRNPE